MSSLDCQYYPPGRHVEQTQIAYTSWFHGKRGHAIRQTFHTDVLFMPIETIDVIRHSFRKWRLAWAGVVLFLWTWARLR
jgi:hypothetical protein